jgi:hypothetical protein
MIWTRQNWENVKNNKEQCENLKYTTPPPNPTLARSSSFVDRYDVLMQSGWSETHIVFSMIGKGTERALLKAYLEGHLILVPRLALALTLQKVGSRN